MFEHEILAENVVKSMHISELLNFEKDRKGLNLTIDEAIYLMKTTVSEKIHTNINDNRTWEFLDTFPPFSEEKDEDRSNDLLHIAVEGYKTGYLHGWKDRGESSLFENKKPLQCANTARASR